MRWRAFVGQWDDQGVFDWTHRDVRGLTWDQARDVIGEWLEPDRTGNCPDCRRTATEALTELADSPESAWVGQVDGEDLRIMPDQANPGNRAE